MSVSYGLRCPWGVRKHSIHPPHGGTSRNVTSFSPLSHFWSLDPPILFLVNVQWTHIYGSLV
jgi:hypothetical protein